MTKYTPINRFAIRPWERYGVAAASIAALLEREESEGPRPLGRALDLGCFQGLDAGQRRAAGGGVTALANPGATMLVPAFRPTRW